MLKLDKKRTTLLIVGVLIIAALAIVYEVRAEDLQADCRTLTSRIDRLKCFDEQQATPVDVISHTNETPLQLPEGAIYRQNDGSSLISVARQMEQGRGVFSPNWQFRYAYPGSDKLLTANTHEELLDYQAGVQILLVRKGSLELQEVGETAVDLETLAEETPLLDRLNVYLTTREIVASDASREETRGLLLLTCIDDIATTSVVLPQPISGRFVNVLARGRFDDLVGETWHVDDTGLMISAPRGEVSVRRMNWMLDNPRLQIEVKLGQTLRPFVFDTFDLPLAIRPLRESCNW